MSPIQGPSHSSCPDGVSCSVLQGRHAATFITRELGPGVNGSLLYVIAELTHSFFNSFIHVITYAIN